MFEPVVLAARFSVLRTPIVNFPGTTWVLHCCIAFSFVATFRPFGSFRLTLCPRFSPFSCAFPSLRVPGPIALAFAFALGSQYQPRGALPSAYSILSTPHRARRSGSLFPARGCCAIFWVSRFVFATSSICSSNFSHAFSGDSNSCTFHVAMTASSSFAAYSSSPRRQLRMLELGLLLVSFNAWQHSFHGGMNASKPSLHCRFTRSCSDLLTPLCPGKL